MNSMAKTRVKTTYECIGPYGSTETHTVHCEHNLSTDIVTFYDDNGEVFLVIDESTSNNLWKALCRLIYPYKFEWGGELNELVEYSDKNTII